MVKMFNIPPEILIPAISAGLIAALAHFVSVLMQGRSNKHDFTVKTFESVSKELSEERKENKGLIDTNVNLRGEKYVLEATIQVTEAQRDAALRAAEDAEETIRSLKEKNFQLTTEVEALKKTCEKLTEELKKAS
jgi:ABC-type molybdate transport system ATPase subunit